jgi:hypothetical protein
LKKCREYQFLPLQQWLRRYSVEIALLRRFKEFVVVMGVGKAADTGKQALKRVRPFSCEVQIQGAG